MMGIRRPRIAAAVRVLSYVLVLVLLALIGILTVTIVHRRSVIATLEERISLLKSESVPLRFMVLSRSDETVSARFRFYDADGREISSFERSWKGSELSIDSLVVPLGERSLVFPTRVFTDAVPARRGTELFPYYDRDGFPAIFQSASLDGPTRKALSDLFDRVRSMDRGEAGRRSASVVDRLLDGSFGNAVHDLRRFRSFEVGAVYALVARSRGGIEIIRE